MIILDTNALSEPLKPRPNSGYMAWLRLQAPNTLFITSVSAAELLSGIEVLPNGKRKSAI